MHADESAAKAPPQKLVLFVCTGNYYRSRFAEAFFNYNARAEHLDWKAISRGLRLAISQHGISPLSRKELVKRKIPAELFLGEPQALTMDDLKKSDYIVLINETEHRPLLEKYFPKRDDSKIHYWHVPEAGKLNPAKAAQTMSENVEKLLQELGQ